MNIERKVSAAFVLALAVQTGGALIWAGAAAERLSTIEHVQEIRQPAFERLARVEAKLDAVDAQLDRIERKLEAMDAR